MGYLADETPLHPHPFWLQRDARRKFTHYPPFVTREDRGWWDDRTVVMLWDERAYLRKGHF